MAHDVLERAMEPTSGSRQSNTVIAHVPKHVRESAAKLAVNDIPMHVKDIGVPLPQAESIQEAFRLGLLGDVSGASEKLIASGLPKETVSLLVKEMERQ